MPWIVKSDPETFSIDDLEKSLKQTTSWDGVRNFQARNYLRSMKKGEKAIFYHSSADPPGVVGIVEVVKEAYPEKKAPDWSAVDLKLRRRLETTISIDELRATKGLEKLLILRKGNRLSVTPVTDDEYERILALAD